MKKLLLTLSALLIVAIAFSQQTLTIKNEAQASRLKYLSPQDGVPNASPLMVSHVLPPKQNSGGLRDVTQVKFSSSFNGFMLLVSESQCLTVNNDLKLINFTQRAPESIVQANGGSTAATGIITNSFSVNDGATWDTTNIIFSVQGTSHCRYPSGGIYNPAGNTDPMNAYAVVAGPCTDDVNWVQNYFGSMKLDETNNDQQFYDNQNGNVHQQMPRLSFTTCADKAFVLGSDYDFNNLPSPYLGGVINRGVFNGTTNAFDWSQIHVHVPFATDQAGDQQFANLGNIAFNDDGSVGYYVIIGVDSVNQVGFYPIIFKSTDFGVTWNQQSFFDFRDIPAWADFPTYLVPTTTGEFKPFFSSSDGFDAVIDMNGALHLICTIYSSYSDNTDSLGFTWQGGALKPLIFDVHQIGDVWDAYFIDSLIASNGQYSLTPWSSATGAIFADARIQASTSPDRSKVFAVWVDTDPLLSTTNEFPDLKGLGIDLANNYVNTGVINFTNTTDFAYINFWHYVSDFALDAGGGTFTVPVTVSESRDGSYSMDATMDHYFVNDVAFPFLVGVPPVNNVTFTVDQNYPNPFSNQTQIKVTLDKASDVSLKITNILGQEVGNKNFSFSAGSHNINLSKGNLSSGVYNFIVSADGKQISKTMIVQ